MKWLLIGFVVLIFTALLLASYLFKEVTDTAKEVYEPVHRTIPEKRIEKPLNVAKADPFSILILGVDERENDSGRSDTMIVMTVNPNTSSTKMVSIPRDTYTEIIGEKMSDKINHSYAFGGVEMAMATTENLLDIPIDYVVQVNMESFVDIVDAIGGIQIENAFSFHSEGYDFAEGSIALNGEQALEYVRMRYEDPNGDFGRQDRQKQIIQAVLHEAASIQSVLKLNAILDSVGEHVRTNMTYSNMKDIQARYRSAITHIDQLYFEQGAGETIDGVWYYMMNEEELEMVSEELKVHLEILNVRKSAVPPFTLE